MCRGKPTVPENIKGTLTSSGSDSMYTSILTLLLYKPCTIAIPKHAGPSRLEYYACVVAFKPDL